MLTSSRREYIFFLVPRAGIIFSEKPGKNLFVNETKSGHPNKRLFLIDI